MFQLSGSGIVTGGADAVWSQRFRWRTKPPLGALLNRSHPLTRGLINCFLFNERAGLTAYDLARSLTGTFATGGITPWGADSVESGASTIGLTAPAVNIPVADVDYLGDLSCIAFGTLRIGSSFHHIFGKSASNGATNNPLEFRASNAATPALQIVTADASNLNLWVTSSTVSLGVHHQLAVTRPRVLNTAPTFYIDGRPCATATLSAGGSAVTATGTNADIRLWRRTDGGTAYDGWLTMLLVYNRIVQAAEMRELHVNPYQIILPNRLW